MTFPEMVADLAADFKGAAMRRTGALAQLAGLVKGLVSAVDAEVSDAIGSVRSTSGAKVYLPKSKRAAGVGAVPAARAFPKPARVRAAKKDIELESARGMLEEKEKAEAEKVAVVTKLSTLKGFAVLDKMEQEAMVSRVLAMRRAKAREKEEEKAKVVEMAKARAEGVRAEFAGRFAKPEKVVGKTEKFEGYMAELKDAIERERAAFEKAGLAQGKTDLVKELERAQRTGKIKALSGKDAEKANVLLDKLSGHTEAVKSGIKALHDSLATQLLGPLAGVYATTKGFVTSTVKHYADTVKETAKRFMSEHLDRNKLLAEMGHLRKEGKEVPAMLRLQMMLSTVMNGIMSAMFGVLKAAPLIAAGLVAVKFLGEAIGAEIVKHLPSWMGGPGKEKEAEADSAKATEERKKRGAAGERTTEDIRFDKLSERIVALQARKWGPETAAGPLSKQEEADLKTMTDMLFAMKEKETKDVGMGVKGEGFFSSLKRSWHKGGGMLSVVKDVAGRRREGEEADRLVDATYNLNKSAEALASAREKPAVQGGSAINVNSIQTGAGGAQVHPHTEKMSKLLFEEGAEDDIYR
jgi:hypothetical protein